MKTSGSIICLLLLCLQFMSAQDLTLGLQINDLALHPMQPMAKPTYLGTITDPSFGTTIRCPDTEHFE